MCTKTIVESTTEAAKGRGPISAVSHGIGGFASGIGKEIKSPFKVPDPPPVVPPEDLSGEKKRQRARAIQRTLGGRPGPGRGATVRSRGAGAGTPALKQRTGG